MKRLILELLPELVPSEKSLRLSDPAALQLRARLLIRASDSVDIIGPDAREPGEINRLIEHFMPAGTTVESHCPYCLQKREATPHECPLLQFP